MDRKALIGILIAIVLVVGVLAFVNNNGKVTGDVIAENNIENLHETKLAIEGMYCEACAYGVKSQIEEVEGVVKANIDYKTATGIVRFDADKVNPETIAAASTAYPASVVEDKKI